MYSMRRNEQMNPSLKQKRSGLLLADPASLPSEAHGLPNRANGFIWGIHPHFPETSFLTPKFPLQEFRKKLGCALAFDCSGLHRVEPRSRESPGFHSDQ
jgi:hypothetical protein